MANDFEVSEDTIVNWEQERVIPAVKHMPKIIAFLGYFPMEIDTSILAGQIKQFRYLNGLTPKQLGSLISTHSSTILGWEKETNKPANKKREMIELLLKN